MTTIPNRMAPRTQAVDGDGGSGAAVRGRAARAGLGLPGPVRPGPALPGLAGPVRDPDREPAAFPAVVLVERPDTAPLVLREAGRCVSARTVPAEPAPAAFRPVGRGPGEGRLAAERPSRGGVWSATTISASR
ncbi:hypothetical protein [Humibacillus sp. DSM 29435]|uniref:hypothetical protein n=1 Tax=Humibacillus sp. DSM 29435 TaxID=1869167 RepID=UPI0020C74DD2|nr:hypothetical protein [Humibacillus sp. DSM 29435]